MRAWSFIFCVALLLAGCNRTPVLPVSSDPIERVVQEECAKPEPQGLWALGVTTPTNVLPKDVAIKILSGRAGSSTNITIVEMEEVTIVHSDMRLFEHDLSDVAKHWTVVVAETKSGTNLVFLQRIPKGNTNVVWTYFIR